METQARHKLILLVEDQAIIAMKQKRDLESFGYAAVTVLHGEDALSMVRENRGIDLVLMDIDLGHGLDGTEAARLILAERELPIVFLSSHTEREVVEKTEQITSYGYVVKSSGPIVLDASIKMAFKLFESNRRLAIAEAQAQEQLRILNLGEETAHLASWSWRVDSNEIYWSENHYRIYGVDPKEFTPSADYSSQFVHPDDRELVRGYLSRLFEEKRSPGVSDHRIITPAGETRWIRGNTQVILNDAGEIEELVGGILDITEWKADQT